MNKKNPTKSIKKLLFNKNITTSSKNDEQIISETKENFYKRLLKDTTTQ